MAAGASHCLHGWTSSVSLTAPTYRGPADFCQGVVFRAQASTDWDVRGSAGYTCVCRATETGQSMNLKPAVIYSKTASSKMHMCALSIYPVIVTPATARSLFKYYLCDIYKILA